jgi:uncharacterized protein YjbJ (UPF0337 family)
MICAWRQPGTEATRQRRRTTYAVTARAVAAVTEWSGIMGGKMDQVKGRIKEAAGVLTGDDRLEREGQLDQVVGKVKETAANAVDTMKDALTSKRPRHPAK